MLTVEIDLLRPGVSTGTWSAAVHDGEFSEGVLGKSFARDVQPSAVWFGDVERVGCGVDLKNICLEYLFAAGGLAGYFASIQCLTGRAVPRYLQPVQVASARQIISGKLGAGCYP